MHTAGTARPDSLAATVAPAIAALDAALRADGHVFVGGPAMHELLARQGELTDWPAFAASWDDLPIDAYMADHGRYRRRRHAVYVATAEAIIAGPRQPHYQGLDYNRLNGGVERWFAPIEPRFATGASLGVILAFCHGLFSRLAAEVATWHVEVHQFRIEAARGQSGLPTPEGMHRDGVDYVLVLLVERSNIDSGTTLIGNSADGFTSSFTLVAPFDAALVDDHRVFHGVTPVQAIDPDLPAHRDVLVVTFRRAGDRGPPQTGTKP